MTAETLENMTLEEKKQLLRQLAAEKKRIRTSPLSFSQQQLWYLHQMEDIKFSYNIPYRIRLEGSLHVQALIDSLDAVVKRHEPLRTTYHLVNGQPRQVIRPCAVEIPVCDLSTHSAEEQGLILQQMTEEYGQIVFPLEERPPWSATLVRLSENLHVLLFTIHHIAADGWSMKILFDEWAAAYDAYATGRHPELEPLPIQYTDYVKWLHSPEYTKIVDRQLDYWLGTLKGAPQFLDMPTDFARPHRKVTKGNEFPFALPNVLMRKVEAIATQERVTVYTVLLAAFYVLLYRYTKQEDLLIGTPMTGRLQRETDALIGMFVQTVVLRTKCAPSSSFYELLAEVRRVVVDATDHQAVSFEQIVERLRPDRDRSYHPIFQVMFAYEFSAPDERKSAGLCFRPEAVTNSVSKFDLTLNLTHTGHGCVGSIEYRDDLFRLETIERLAGHYVTLLENALESPDMAIAELQMLTDREQHQILWEWNKADLLEPKAICLHEWFAQQAADTPDRVFVRHDETEWTYAELNERSNQLANRLMREGVQPDSLVALLLDRSPEILVCMLAVWKVGAAYVPLDPEHPDARLEKIIRASNASLLVTQESHCRRLDAIGSPILILDASGYDQCMEAKIFSGVPSNPHRLAYVMFTSGTTSEPKGVMVQHNMLVSTAMSNEIAYRLQEFEVRLLQFANYTFDVFVGDFLRTLIGKGTMVMCPKRLRWDLPGLARLLHMERISILESTPPLIVPLFKYVYDSGMILSDLQVVIMGSDVLLPEDLRTLFDRFGNKVRLINSYGTTETAIDSSYFEATEGSLEELRQVPIGRPLDNSRFYILDEHQNLLPVGLPGELYIAGNVASGYFNNEELTRSKFLSDPFLKGGRMYRTGDIARWLPDGQVELIGRKDFQVKIRGFRIELGDIEATLMKHESVEQAAVVTQDVHGIPKNLVACVSLNEGYSFEEQKLLSLLREHLPNYMVPSAIIPLPHLPLTSNGKVDRTELKQKILHVAIDPRATLDHNRVHDTIPRNMVEFEIQKIWEGLLGISPISMRDKFFEIGGHSLLMIQMLSKIRETFNVEIELSHIFDHGTIEQLAQVINLGGVVRPASFLVPLRAHGTKPPLFVVHHIGGYWFRYMEIVRQLGEDYPVYGLQASKPDGDFDDLIEMAAHYIKEIKRVQPEGPYYLMGHSFGGNVVYEIAVQLQRQGEQVGLLCILDTYLPEFKPDATEAELLLDYIERFNLSEEETQRLLEMDKSTRTKEILRLGQQAKYLTPDVNEEQMSNILEMFVKHNRALARYVKPTEGYRGNVLFFRALEEQVDSTIGWESFVKGPIECIEMQATHSMLLEGKHAEQIAYRLRESLVEKRAGNQ